MKINFKNFLKFLLIIIFTILILYFGYQEFLQFKYPLHKISNLINHSTLPDNVYIHHEENHGTFQFIRDTYIKDGIVNDYQKSTHTLQPNQNTNFLIIIDNNKNYLIDYSNKTINEYEENLNIDERKSYYHSYSATNTFYSLVQYRAEKDHQEIYKYLGKETINGKRCYKFSFTTHDNTYYSKTVFYLDIETNLILQVDYYDSPNRKIYYRHLRISL